MKNLVYGYVRVSSIRQSEEGQSIETQISKLKSYAKLHDFEIEEIFIDRGVSGAVPLFKRPMGRELLERVIKGDTILVTKLDRAFRSSVDALSCVDKLSKLDIKMHLLDFGGDVCSSDGAGRLFFAMLSAFSQFERERLGERVRETKFHMRQAGRFLGGSRTLGFQIDDQGYLVSDPKEQLIISKILRLRNQGLPLREIASKVSVPERTVSHSTVRRVLDRHHG